MTARIEDRSDSMHYYLYEADVPLPRTIVFDWHGTPGHVGGPYIEVRWIDGQALTAFSTIRGGNRIDFTEENFRAEVTEWIEHNLADFVENEG